MREILTLMFMFLINININLLVSLIKQEINYISNVLNHSYI